MSAEILEFPDSPAHRVQVQRQDGPCMVLILPVVRIERPETASDRLDRFLARVLDGDQPA
jgi:hypothetical protein